MWAEISAVVRIGWVRVHHSTRSWRYSLMVNHSSEESNDPERTKRVEGPNKSCGMFISLRLKQEDSM